MSVIVYKDGVLAADSQWTSDGQKGVVHPKQPKIMRTHDGAGMIGLCGSLGWEPVVKRVWEKMKNPLDAVGSRMFIQVLGENADWTALLIYGDTVMEASGGNPPHLTQTPTAIGSGADLAFGAMAMGASAKEAVIVATRYSATCGGRVVCLEMDPHIKRGRGTSRKRSLA